jgi:hypothetical protein
VTGDWRVAMPSGSHPLGIWLSAVFPKTLRAGFRMPLVLAQVVPVPARPPSSVGANLTPSVQTWRQRARSGNSWSARTRP